MSSFHPPNPKGLDAQPKHTKTVPLTVFVAVAVVAVVFGFMAGSTAGNDSSALAAANQKVSQLEAQLALKGPQAAPGESAAPTAASAAPAAAPNPAAAPVVLSGEGEMNSGKVPLKGNYSVTWTTLGACYYSGTLKAIDHPVGGDTVFNASHEASGRGNIYNLKGADYYLGVITGPAPTCGWTVTLTPAP